MKWWQSIGVMLGVAITSVFLLPLEGMVPKECAPKECFSQRSIQAVLAKLSLRAHMSQSDVILITYRGHLIYLYGAEKCYEPMETRSVTKSFVCLAIGMLMQEGKICSLQTPVSHYFPEWKQGWKKEITIAHLLSNTSGLALDVGNELYDAPDSVKLALATDVTSVPGTRFIYNNKATNLAAAIVEKASGMRIHEYLKSRLFQPLDIRSDTWLSDPAGNNYGMSHLMLSACDLAKVGRLLMDKGRWNDRTLLAQEWIEMLMQPSQSCNPFYGALWWLDYRQLKLWWDDPLLDLYASEGVSRCYVDALRHLHGQVFSFTEPASYGNFYEQCASRLACNFEGEKETVSRFIAQVEAKGLPLARWDEAELHSFSARGYLGQQLLILPQDKLVAVRLARSCGQLEEKIDAFADFEGVVHELAEEIRACPHAVEYIKLP